MSPVLDGPGTQEKVWLDSGWFERLPPFDPLSGSVRRVVVVGPHPDDEILGAGATVSFLSRSGCDVVLLAVTDGESSHPGRQEELRRVRPSESAAALAVLGVRPVDIVRLRLPDGAVRDEDLRAPMDRVLETGDLVLAPWERDGHPDHDACGRAAREAARSAGAELFQYLVWAWHWADPQDIPWDRAQRLDPGTGPAERKRRAVACFASQLDGPDPILPPHVLGRLTRDHEILLRS